MGTSESEPRRFRIYKFRVPGKNNQTGDNSTAFDPIAIEGPDTGPDPMTKKGGRDVDRTPPWIDVIELTDEVREALKRR